MVPLLNERENLAPLLDEIAATVADDTTRTYELILVDDGSTDGSVEILRQIETEYSWVNVIELRRRFGQTAALAAGFRLARGAVIVPMDGDLQNDPRDVPKLLDQLTKHPDCDVVSGWRKERHDVFLTRRLPSQIANALVRHLTRCHAVHDFGCTLKAYRREVLQDIELYGEMHRFLPAICTWRGAKVSECVVNHRPRLRGRSKYGLRRTAKVLLDLITLKFLGDYLSKPLYFFGKIALVMAASSFLTLAVAVLQKFGYLYSGDSLNLNRNVLVLFSMMLFLMAFMLVMLGVISELLIRIYHESRETPYYAIRRVTDPLARSTRPAKGIPEASPPVKDRLTLHPIMDASKKEG